MTISAAPARPAAAPPAPQDANAHKPKRGGTRPRGEPITRGGMA